MTHLLSSDRISCAYSPAKQGGQLTVEAALLDRNEVTFVVNTLLSPGLCSSLDQVCLQFLRFRDYRYRARSYQQNNRNELWQVQLSKLTGALFTFSKRDVILGLSHASSCPFLDVDDSGNGLVANEWLPTRGRPSKARGIL